MASPPEYDKEPKAPDKSATNVSDDDLDSLHDIDNDQQYDLESNSTDTLHNDYFGCEQVEALDESALRSLLEEAIGFKSFKDIQGRSGLFKNLLRNASEDKPGIGAAKVTVKGDGKRIVRNVLPHSNSLQDLVAALAGNPLSRHLQQQQEQQQPPVPGVSARVTHSRSLPTGVDTPLPMGEEAACVGAEYVATVHCVNPSPLPERRVSASNIQNGTEIELLNRRSKQMFPMTYTARATLEIGSGGGASSGRAVTTTTASNQCADGDVSPQVDSAIPFSCITTPEVVASCNSTSSTSPSAVAADPKLASSYRAVASLTGEAEDSPASSEPNFASPDDLASASPEGFASASSAVPVSTVASISRQKSLDENGNAVQGYSSPQSGSSQHKKSRRKKSSKNETVITSDQIEGHRGDKNVDELLRFIENEDYEPTLEMRSKLEQRKKHKDDSDDKSGKKRSTERRREKGKIKRATSMEELSRTKLEDLTDKPEPTLRKHKKERWTDVHVCAKAERRSWGDDARDAFYFRERSEPTPVVVDAVIDPTAELTDFQTVTKKRKPRRRTDDGERESAAGDAPPRRPRPPSPRHVRDSAPPSDRSNDSNDDMDSVHSLPADAASAGVRTALGTPAAPPASAPPAQPHISYAEIARTRHNIPDLIESCNFYTEGEGGTVETVARCAPRADECPPAAPGDADGYPALEARGGRRTRDKPPPPMSARRDRKERSEGARPPTECPAPDVVGDRRPPVILLDSAARPRDMDGVTFGFDINEQLLGAPTRRPRCDLVRDAVESAAGVPVRAGCAALCYLPPAPLADTHHLHQIIDYVGAAWEDIVRCGGGKVRYYSE